METIQMIDNVESVQGLFTNPLDNGNVNIDRIYFTRPATRKNYQSMVNDIITKLGMDPDPYGDDVIDHNEFFYWLKGNILIKVQYKRNSFIHDIKKAI